MVETPENLNPLPARFASIAIADLPIDRAYTYAIPPEFAGRVTLGLRCEVPFARATRIGYCVGLTDTPDCPPEKCRPIIALPDPEPRVDARMLDLTRWIADYYCCSWGQALDAVLPAGVRKQTREKTLRWVIPLPPPTDAPPLTPEQEQLLAALAAAGGPLPAADLARRAGTTSAPIHTLEKRGRVRIEKRKMTDPILDMPLEPPAVHVPTPAQATAIEAIGAAVDTAEFRTFLLHGVTGSGKTEVYLKVLERVLAKGRQAIILVPEIALTPQTVGRFRARFDRVAVLHSHLAEGPRAAQWRQIRSGEASVVIGARSAIFAPTRSLGLVVVDEEHEPTFKQDSVPRYHARDVAVVRARREKAVVILGSATPSLESWRNAMRHRYTLLQLPGRVESRPLPPVEICDLGQEFREQKRYPLLSRRLVLRIRDALKRKEQVLLFLNRRGFVTLLACPACKYIFRCSRCDIALTVHKARNAALCHYCGQSLPIPSGCPACGKDRLRQMGVGTERIEEEIRREFPEIAAARLDSDATRKKGKYTEVLGGLRIGELDLVVGTQMIAKGLDYPNVTVVGVISADTALHLKDFRSAERTFQLLTQVSGRAGRGPKGGLVCVQTFHPTHYAVETASRHDFEGFAAKELEYRHLLGYPPFTRMIRLLVEGKNEEAVKKRAEAIATSALDLIPAGKGEILGPSPCPIPRIKDRWRWHVCLKAESRADLDLALRPLRDGNALLTRRGVITTVDVDPQNML